MPRLPCWSPNVPALLLSGALVLSFGLNVLFISRAEPWPGEVHDELAATITDLRLTQRQLAQCQAAHAQADSLLNGYPPRTDLSGVDY